MPYFLLGEYITECLIIRVKNTLRIANSEASDANSALLRKILIVDIVPLFGLIQLLAKKTKG